MRTWLLRGAVMAILHAAAQTITAGFAVYQPTSLTMIEALVLGVLVGIAAVWGAVDTWRAVPAREKAWLIGALIAGWGAGVLGVIGKALFVDQTGVSELGGALTGGAAFTALLVLVPAAIGLFVGRSIKPKKRADDEDGDVEAERPARGRHAQRGGPARSTPRS